LRPSVDAAFAACGLLSRGEAFAATAFGFPLAALAPVVFLPLAALPVAVLAPLAPELLAVLTTLAPGLLSVLATLAVLAGAAASFERSATGSVMDGFSAAWAVPRNRTGRR
jgi:hypothetical protein